MEVLRVCIVGIILGATWRSADALATMSVDLSSEFMKLAIVKPGVPMEIVLNSESQRKTPFAVAIRNGERSFGDAALSTCIRSPKDCFIFFLDLLGKNSSHGLVKLYQERFPQYSLEDDPVSKRVVFKAGQDVSYAPEELLAMLLKYAKDLAEKYAEHPISDAVITVPSYYTQIERIAINYAGRLAGINVLQLINDNTAAALNYGVFRRKEMNSTMQYIMLYDMGSTGTTASVVGYHLTKLKDADGRAVETAQLVVKGVGYDRTLGGLEIDLRLRKFFIEKFAEKTKKDASKNPSALVKLLKEAGRVKKVLSANTEHMAQIEGLMDDVDFATKLTRAELESICKDVFDRIPAVVEQAILAANVGVDEIQQVIILGGGTRIPKVQEKLLAAVKKSELGKSLNSDEAIAMGAVYQAAHLSKGFRVKQFEVVDATVIPIVVEFERGSKIDSDEPVSKIVKRVLFTRSNGFPQRKVLTFPKHTTDFEFTVRYSDYEFLSPAERTYVADGLNFNIGLKGVTEAFTKHEDKRPKGVKAHFKVDHSGVFVLDHAEATFEYEKEEEVPSTIDKIGQSISNFFSGSKENVTNATQPDPPSDEINAATGAESTNNVTEKPAEEAGKLLTMTLVNKTITVKEKLQEIVTRLDLADYPEKEFTQTKKRLREMDDKDKEKVEREKARNILETYIFNTQDNLYQPMYEKVTTETDRETVRKVLVEASEWLEEEATIQQASVYKKKLKSLEDAMKDIADRVSEMEKRPRVLGDLDKHLNTTRVFYEMMKNNNIIDSIYTETELINLEKLIQETEEWKANNVKLQEAAALTAAPVMRVVDVVEKIRALDREFKYLMNKARITKPKVKLNTTSSKAKKTKDKKDTANSTTDSETIPADGGADQPPANEEYSFPSDEDISKQKQQPLGAESTKATEHEDIFQSEADDQEGDQRRHSTDENEPVTHSPEEL